MSGMEMESTKEMFTRSSSRGGQGGPEALDCSLLLCEFLVRSACFYTVQLGSSIRYQFCQGLHTGVIGYAQKLERW